MVVHVDHRFLLPEALRQHFLTPLYRITVAMLFVVFTTSLAG